LTIQKNKNIVNKYHILEVELWFFNTAFLNISVIVNKRQRIPMGQSKIDNPEKLAIYRLRKTKQKKNTTQYVLDTNIHKQTKVLIFAVF
jgi:hypothetical protein